MSVASSQPGWPVQLATARLLLTHTAVVALFPKCVSDPITPLLSHPHQFAQKLWEEPGLLGTVPMHFYGSVVDIPALDHLLSEVQGVTILTSKESLHRVGEAIPALFRALMERATCPVPPPGACRLSSAACLAGGHPVTELNVFIIGISDQHFSRSPCSTSTVSWS